MSWRLRSMAAGALHLPAAELKTLIALADYASDDGVCWPSKRTIGDITGLSSATIKRAVRGLVTRGLVADTGRRRAGCAVRQLDVAALGHADQIALYQGSPMTPGGLTRDPRNGSPMTPGGLTHDPLKGSPVTPGGLTRDPRNGSPMTPGGLTHDPLKGSPVTPGGLIGDPPKGSPVTPGGLNPDPPVYIWDPHHDPHHSPTSDRGEGDGQAGLIQALRGKAIAGDDWTPTASDRTVLGRLIRDVGAPGLLRVAESMPGYRTHPVSSLVSHLDRQSNGRARPTVSAELAVGGGDRQAEPLPDRADAINQLTRQLEASAPDGAATVRHAAIAWDPIARTLIDWRPSVGPFLERMTHLVTVDDGEALTVHLDGPADEVLLLRGRIAANELDQLASEVEPRRPRRIHLHTAGATP